MASRLGGSVNVARRLAAQASQLYGNNLVHLLTDMCKGEQGFHIDLEDTVVRGVRFNPGYFNGVGIDGTVDTTGPGQPSNPSGTAAEVDSPSPCSISNAGPSSSVTWWRASSIRPWRRLVVDFTAAPPRSRAPSRRYHFLSLC